MKKQLTINIDVDDEVIKVWEKLASHYKMLKEFPQCPNYNALTMSEIELLLYKMMEPAMKNVDNEKSKSTKKTGAGAGFCGIDSVTGRPIYRGI